MATRRRPLTSPDTQPGRAPTARARQAATRPAASRRPVPQAVSHTPSASEPCFIVGIGASAGGLEALEAFFRQMPPDNGMAFVVVMHQPMDYVSLLPELLGRWTTMPAHPTADATQLAPNSVYIAPSGKYLSMLQATLYHLDPPPGAGLRFPIDVWFRALANDYGDRAVGIVLSGTGTDGTQGVQAIQAAAGMTMVQSLESAQYDGMPRSALATGLVTYVLAPSDMPAQLLASTHAPVYQTREPAPVPPDVLQKICRLLRDHTGHDFSGYKTYTVARRMVRRMQTHQLQNPLQYVELVQTQPHELDVLLQELLIGVTRFFRDPEAFDRLAHEFLPPLLAAKAAYEDIRVWVPGCASGEEAYTLGILLYEGLERMGQPCRVQIFATDLDGQAIETARRGVYPARVAADLRPDRLDRFFLKDQESYRVAKTIRDLVIFAPHNMLSDPPFTKLDLLSCRNLLIYLDITLQKRLVPVWHYALRPQGLLFLGTAETITGYDELFTSVDTHCKIYTRNATAPTALAMAPPRVDALGSTKPGLGTRNAVAVLADKLLAECYAPPSVIVNDQGDIVHIHGQTGAYLEPAPGQPRLHIVAMAREGLRLPLTTAMRRTAMGENLVIQKDVQVKTNGDSVRVHVVVQKIAAPAALRGLLRVSFEPAVEQTSLPAAPASGRPPAKPSRRVAALEQELQQTQAALQNAIRELATVHEELMPSSEEMQATNEELHSANEELQTTREELQALNEELQTVNAELRHKLDALSEAHDDMANLLNSVEIASIFLDNELHIKRFSSQATRILPLMPSDVGRPLRDLASTLDYQGLENDAHEVLRTLVATEREVPAKAGTWYLIRLRPYRTVRNVINGLVITFVDVTQLKQAELRAQAAHAYAESIVHTVPSPLVVLDAELCVMSANQAFYQVFHASPGTVVQRHIYALGEGQWNSAALRELLEKVLPHNHIVHDVELIYDFPHSGRKVLLLNARRLEQAAGLPALILLAMRETSTTSLDGGPT